MTAPTAAELARTAVARARVGTLTTHAPGGGSRETAVDVRDDRGALLVSLTAAGPAAPELAARPRVAVRVAPDGCEPVALAGPARRVGDGPGGLALYRLQPDDVRVGRRGREVEPGDYRAAAPDPLRDHAEAILGRLRRGHGDALAACLRVHGHTGVRWAEPLALDRYGLELAAARDDGMEVVRLDFPAPLTSLADLGPDLAAVMLRGGGCGGGACGGCRET